MGISSCGYFVSVVQGEVKPFANYKSLILVRYSPHLPFVFFGDIYHGKRAILSWLSLIKGKYNHEAKANKMNKIRGLQIKSAYFFAGLRKYSIFASRNTRI